MRLIGYTSTILLFISIGLNSVFGQVCIELPPMNGTPAMGFPFPTSVVPAGYSPFVGTCDILPGTPGGSWNGNWGGFSPFNTYWSMDIDGQSVAGGQIMHCVFQSGYTEQFSRTLTGLTIGTSYYVQVQWQQCSMWAFTSMGTFNSGGGRLAMFLQGTPPQIYTSTGGLSDEWQTATYVFTATSTSHVLVIGTDETATPLLGPSGEIVIDNLPCSVTLPVTLTGFDYDCETDSETTNLSWEVEHEVDGDHYEVWVSADGASYSKEGEVACSGLSTYHYPMNKRNGTTYVQLSLIGKDGTISYLNTFSIDCELAQVEVYPNPASDNVSIVAPSTFRMSAIEIYDVLGNSVVHMEHDFSKMKNLQLDVSDFAAGVYTLKVVSVTGKTAYIQLMID